jgi:hypothetical protein
MRILWSACVLACLAFTVSCTTTPWYLYREDLFAGKQALRHSDYSRARTLFVKAAGEQKRTTAYAFAATACYKMGDLASAEGYIFDAENAEGGAYPYVRTAGYKALIFLKEGKKEEGMAALRAYIDMYGRLYPLMTIDDVEDMWKRGEIDQARLEKLVDEQIVNYEQEIDWAVSTGTGYYATRLPFGIPFFIPD